MWFGVVHDKTMWIFHSASSVYVYPGCVFNVCGTPKAIASKVVAAGQSFVCAPTLHADLCTGPIIDQQQPGRNLALPDAWRNPKQFQCPGHGARRQWKERLSRKSL